MNNIQIIILYQVLCQCCVTGECKNSFINLPQRICNAKEYRLIHSRDKFCRSCGLPSKSEKDQEVLCDLVEDYFNLYDLREYCDGPIQTVNGIFCYVKNYDRVQRRYEHVNYRRNILNIIVFLPMLNSYLFLHQTYRYKPRGTTVSFIMKRIVNEAVNELKHSMRFDITLFKDFTCKCG